MLLIYPPGARAVEPPLGLARLSGFLDAMGQGSRCLDLGREALDYLLGLDPAATESGAALALKRRRRNLEALCRAPAYALAARHERAVLELNRALRLCSSPWGVEAGLADYRDPARSPLRRADLLATAQDYASHVYFGLFERRISAELAGTGYTKVGISLIFLSQALPAFALIGYIRQAFPGIQIYLGGGLITSWVAQGALKTDETFEGLVDVILPGRGEDELGAVLGSDSLPPFENAIPRFDDFAGLSYLAPLKVLPYNLSYGCPWKRCTFCPERAEDARYLPLSAERARAELSALVERYQPGMFHFTDNELAPPHLRALADSPPGPPWYGFARFSKLLTSTDFCRRLAASGCRMLQLGLESGDQGVLDALDKGTRLADIDEALRALAEAGIAVYLYVLFGTPAEDRDSALRTRDFVAARAGLIDFVNVAIFNMPVSSPEAARLPSRPFYEGDLALYTEFEHPAGWNRDRVRRFIADDFESDADIRPIILRNPNIFTSSHAPFLPGRPR